MVIDMIGFFLYECFVRFGIIFGSLISGIVL